MRLSRMRRHLAVASSLGGAALAASMLLGSGVASAAITIPPFPTSVGTYPQFLTNNYQMSNVDHSEGSDTTLFAMQTIGNLYTDAGLFPFGCHPTANNQNCLTQSGNGGSNPNNTQTDTVDNFNSTEILNGVSNVGSGNGQAELCGNNVPLNTTADFARSSKPVGAISGCPMVQLGFAKDGVTAVDFPSVEPELYGGATGYNALSTSLGGFTSYVMSGVNVGNPVLTPFPSGGIGPVAAGWLPGDPFTCDQTSTCSGTPFSDVEAGTNNGGLTSVGYRLWCAHGGVATAEQSQITDWGQLTNLSGGTVSPGDGAPIGVPIRIIGVNAGSGTAATFNNFTKAGQTAGNCTSSSSNFNANAASGANPQANQGGTSTNLEIALENDSAQVGDFANANWGATDPADQAVDIATSLYYMGNGAYVTNSFTTTASLEVNSGLVSPSLPSSFVATQLTMNQQPASVGTEYGNFLPTSRTLFNIYRTDKVKASTAGFLNWLCDTNPATSGSGSTAFSSGGTLAKQTDHITGGNYDADLTSIIAGQYGFARLSDATHELGNTAQTTGNGVVNPNASCDASASIGTITPGTNTVTLSAPVDPAVQIGWQVATAPGFSANIAYPATNNHNVTTTPATTVIGISGSTLTLSGNVTTGTGTTAPSTLYFPGHPPILDVATANLGS